MPIRVATCELSFSRGGHRQVVSKGADFDFTDTEIAGFESIHPGCLVAPKEDPAPATETVAPAAEVQAGETASG